MDGVLLMVASLTTLLLPSLGIGITTPTRNPSSRSQKKGILMVAFGTTRPEARVALERIEKEARRAFPGIEVRWAFTSRFTRKKLLGEGERIDSPEIMLARMMDEGFTHVAVLPLQVIPGQEFHELAWNASLFAQMTRGIAVIRVARPLLSSHLDLARVAEIMMRALPESRKSEEAVLFIGHGNANHPADAIYAAMHCAFQELDPRVYVGTLSGHPGPEQIVQRLTHRGVRKAFLLPLMTLAGHHARKDIGGDHAGSWKSIMAANGIECEVICSGLMEVEGIRALWLEHLQAALESFDGHFPSETVP